MTQLAIIVATKISNFLLFTNKWLETLIYSSSTSTIQSTGLAKFVKYVRDGKPGSISSLQDIANLHGPVFHDISREVKATIIQRCTSKRLRRYALREADISLDNLIAKARSLEISEVQACGMEKTLP